MADRPLTSYGARPKSQFADLEAAGIDPGRVMHDYVDEPGVSNLG